MISADVNAFKLLHVNETLKLLEPEAWTTQLQKWTSQLESRLKVGAGLALTIGLLTLAFATEGRSRVLTWLQGETQAILTEESLVTDILTLQSRRLTPNCRLEKWRDQMGPLKVYVGAWSNSQCTHSKKISHL